jgi:RNA polymerase sigma-70 factor, ECF subfamily
MHAHAPARAFSTQAGLRSERGGRLYYAYTRGPLDRFSFDKEYVQRLTERDPDVERHFTAYFGDLLTIKLRSRLRQPQQVEDIRQETFLRVLTSLRRGSGVDHPERLGAFVNSVCNHVLLEFYRSDARSAPLADDAAQPLDQHPSAESDLVSRENKQQVRDILAELPERDRELLRLIFFEERDKSEVCQKFNVGREYLRVLLHRAKVRFRSSLRKSAWRAD